MTLLKFSSRFSVLASGAISVLLTMSAEAQVESCLEFEDAIFLASKISPAVQGAKADLRQAKSDTVIAKSVVLPQVSAFAKTAAGEQGLVAGEFSNELGLRASQRLFDFGDARLATQAARSAEQAAEFEVESVETSAALSAGLLFLDWLQATAELEVTRERIDFFEKEADALEGALLLGGATRTDIAEIHAEKSSAQSARASLELSRQNAHSAITVLTGDTRRPCERSIDTYFLQRPDPTRDAFDIDALIQTAFAQNAELQGLKSTARQSRFSAKRQAKERLPIVELVGIASFSADNLGTATDPRYRVGIDVSVPLYSGAAINGRQSGAQAVYAKARANVESSYRQIEQALRQSVHTVLFLSEQILHQRDVVAHRRSQLAAVEQSYERGVVTLPQLVDTRIDLERDLLILVRTEHEAYRARLKLLSTIGDLK